ncbi:MAG: hypothetical protein NC117_04790 [Pseudoflavonifractor sp.]|nr:hypothetical protein [Pseudoflavonifractor sp.]
MIKRTLLSLLLSVVAVTVLATTADDVLKSAADKYQRLKTISASYSITSGNETAAGTIVTSGDKFHITSPQLTTWYDGRTQWTYSPSSGEVNITEPTAEELQQVNPFAIISAFRKTYLGTMLRSAAGTHKIQLLPVDKRASIRKAVITFDSKSLYPTLIQLTTDNNTTATIKVSGVVAGKKYPASTFVFDKKKYPRAEIIDLR